MLNGAGDVQVVEPPDAIKTVLVRWNSVKIDLNELVLDLQNGKNHYTPSDYKDLTKI